MFKFICEYVYNLDVTAQKQIIADAGADENSTEINALISAFCAEFKLDKYNKGIHSIVKRNLANVELEKNKLQSKKITSFNTLAEK